MARAVPIIPADDLGAMRAFYVDGLGFRVAWEASDGTTGLMGLERDGISLTVDAPMAGHGREACVALHVHSADAYYDEWRTKVRIDDVPKDEPWAARTFSVIDPAGNTLFVIGPPAADSGGPPLPTPPDALRRQFGDLDIYLFDQLLRGRLVPGMRVLDAGCGGGRNLVYLLGHGFDVSAIDSHAQAVADVRQLALDLAPHLPATQFRHESVEACSFAPASFDAVLSSAVLHFADGDAHFDAMVAAMWRVLKPGGVLFCRLASTIGLVGAQPLGGNRFRLPDGSDRYLVTAERLLEMTKALGGSLLDPLKTTVVQDQRSMTTWVLRR